MKNALFSWMDQNNETFEGMALDIWDNPEVALTESFASRRQSTYLEECGFRINREIGQLETAFIAEFGTGKPIIGILGEYDALPGLSQKLSSQKECVEADAPGHGCGHNLLGVAGVKAAVALAKQIDSGEIKGTVRYYGCPAEEQLSGKVIMAKAGVFNDLDCALTWHPMNVTGVWNAGSLAVNSMKFRFKGRAAHAAAQPDAGRSALDAVELMNVGANYLREHVVDSARIHYTITDGGQAPNIVPPKAESWYYVRAPKRYMVEEIVERLEKIAHGAAMMTETQVSVETLVGCYDFMPNQRLSQLLHDNMTALGGVTFEQEAYQFAQDIQATLDESEMRASLRAQHAPESLLKTVIHKEVVENMGLNETLAGSTDVGDVSWIVPTAQFLAASWPIGVPAHSWQATALSGSQVGFNGMNYAAKVLAATALDIFSNPEEILIEAREGFMKDTEGRAYVSPLEERN